MINANRGSYTLIHSLLLWKAPGTRNNLRVLLVGEKDLNRKRNVLINQKGYNQVIVRVKFGQTYA